MVTLSKRMQVNADLCSKGGVVADIGCDHGYLSIYLVQSGKKECAIAMDVRPGPLSKAKENVSAYCLEDKITFRLSDGLEKLSPSEADTVIIAGMGGPLMEEILKKGHDVAACCKELILQPQSDIPHFRRFLMEEGYLLLEEECVLDEGKYYFPMRVCPRTSEIASKGYNLTSDVEFAYGGHTLQQKNPMLKEFLLKEQRVWRDTLDHLASADSDKVDQRKQEIKERLSLIEKALLNYT